MTSQFKNLDHSKIRKGGKIIDRDFLFTIKFRNVIPDKERRKFNKIVDKFKK